MKNLNSLRKIFFTLMVLSSFYCYSQDSSKIIILSKDIGPIIDLNEKLEYNILPVFKQNFLSAMYYMDTDSLYYCKVRLSVREAIKDTTFQVGYNSIQNTAMRVQYFENIKKGNNNFGMQNVELIFANNEEVKNIVKMEKKSVSTSKELDPKSYKFTIAKKLPLNKQNIDYSQFIKKNSYLGVSVGLLFNNSNFDALGKIFNILEENIPEPGYEIPKSNLKFNTFPIFSFSSFIIISKKFLLELNYGFRITSDEEQYLSYNLFTASVGYMIPTFKKTVSFAKIAYTGLEFDAFNRYYSYVSERSSQLESITLTGRASGLKVSLGMKFILSSLLSFDLVGSYNFYPSINVINNYVDSSIEFPTLNLDSFEIGLSFCFTNN